GRTLFPHYLKRGPRTRGHDFVSTQEPVKRTAGADHHQVQLFLGPLQSSNAPPLSWLQAALLALLFRSSASYRSRACTQPLVTEKHHRTGDLETGIRPTLPHEALEILG